MQGLDNTMTNKNTTSDIDQSFWNQVKANLYSANQGNKTLQAWLEPTNLVAADQQNDGTCFVVGAPSELHRYWISENLILRLCSEISNLYKNPFKVQIVVTGEESESQGPVRSDAYEENDRPVLSSAEAEPSLTVNMGRGDQRRRDILNNDYRFDTFVVGRNNEFAHAACHTVAENPDKKEYNPLFIYGPSGMGKTHLLNAVGNHIKEQNPQLRICYITAERFLNETVSAIRHKTMDAFRKQYRESADVFLVDDIQILGGKEATQEEFFYVLNDFIETGRQVVVASDRMPKDIKDLHDRIKTRLEWGVIADIQMPDIETRTAILRYKAEQMRLKVPEDVIGFIAKMSKKSIRELEGNLKGIKMYAELHGISLINLEVAKKVLSSHVSESSTLTIQDIQKIVCDHYNLKLPDLKSSNRQKPLVVARQLAMYMVRKHLDKSLQDIGRSFGGKDHTTVMNALQRIDEMKEKNSDLRSDIDEIETRIHNLTGL